MVTSDLTKKRLEGGTWTVRIRLLKLMSLQRRCKLIFLLEQRAAKTSQVIGV